MSSTTVRINESSCRTLRRMAVDEHVPMQKVLAAAIEAYRRQLFLERANAGYDDAKARAGGKSYAQQISEWDSTLMDGLDPNERWTVDGRVHRKTGRK